MTGQVGYLKGATTCSRIEEVRRCFSGLKQLVAAGSLIMHLHEALTYTCPVVFKQDRFNSARFLVQMRKQMNTLHIYGSKIYSSELRPHISKLY